MSQTVTVEAPGSAPRVEQPNEAPTIAPVRTRRSAIWIAAAIAIVLLGAIAGGVGYNIVSQTNQVLVVQHDIARGSVIAEADLTTIAISEGQNTEAIPVDRANEILGKIAAVDIPAGGLVTAASVTDALAAPDGRAVVGISLKPEQLPLQRLHAGDEVILVLLSNQATAAGAPIEVDIDQTIPAVISQVTYPADSGAGSTIRAVVDVYVNAQLAPQVSAAAAAGAIAVYVAPATGTSQTQESDDETGEGE